MLFFFSLYALLLKLRSYACTAVTIWPASFNFVQRAAEMQRKNMLRTGRRLVWIASGKAEGRSHIFRGAGLETITSCSVSLEVPGWWSLRFIRFSTTVCRTPRDAAMDRGRVSLVKCTFLWMDKKSLEGLQEGLKNGTTQANICVCKYVQIVFRFLRNTVTVVY